MLEHGRVANRRAWAAHQHCSRRSVGRRQAQWSRRTCDGAATGAANQPTARAGPKTAYLDVGLAVSGPSGRKWQRSQRATDDGFDVLGASARMLRAAFADHCAPCSPAGPDAGINQWESFFARQANGKPGIIGKYKVGDSEVGRQDATCRHDVALNWALTETCCLCLLWTFTFTLAACPSPPRPAQGATKDFLEPWEISGRSARACLASWRRLW
ncbi:hypothetical protein K402DRAFT_234480 [Aulographum hederae CBS 113979]|uniref:Uncharacterized protein n=1 Tax=Aulographum hederae CBS 113979 TaxID=1176131 RepID=A0A6G1GL43_9PEZI|nr:hypothetical protein K402DRAFT_234480 [Aulographum hederae CBS 113979]